MATSRSSKIGIFRERNASASDSEKLTKKLVSPTIPIPNTPQINIDSGMSK